MSQETSSLPQTHGVPGDPVGLKSTILETGASTIQDFTPVKQICAHLNAFHVYADDPTRCIEANHYCSHISEDVRQCLIYDSSEKKAKLIGIEYMVTPRVFATLPDEEKKLWHSHEFEVKSGMLIMPAPKAVPDTVWTTAETAEMHDVLPLYGKTYHLWQTDRGDVVPMGAPQLMGSFTSEEQLKPFGGMDGLCGDRDSRFGVSWKEKKQVREQVGKDKKFEIDPAVDAAWKT